MIQQVPSHPRLFAAFLFCPPHHHLLLRLAHPSSVPRQHQSTRVRLSPHPRLFAAFLFCPPHHHLLLRLAHPSSVPRQHQSTRVRLSPHPRLFAAFLFCPPHHHLSFSPTCTTPLSSSPLASSRLDSRRHRIALGEGLHVSRTNGHGAVVSPTRCRRPGAFLV